jgi:hypothetical protein
MKGNFTMQFADSGQFDFRDYQLVKCYLFDSGIERFNDSLRLPKPTDKNYHAILSQIQQVF